MFNQVIESPESRGLLASVPEGGILSISGHTSVYVSIDTVDTSRASTCLRDGELNK